MNKKLHALFAFSTLLLVSCGNGVKDCPHLEHDKETLECLSCRVVVEHHYHDHKCTMCESTSEYIHERITDDESLYKGAVNKGTIEKFTYETEPYAEIALNNAIPGSKIEKSAYAYLPFDYSKEKQYNVLILLHGAGDTEGYWFGQNDRYLQYETNGAVFKNCFKENPAGNITKDLLDLMVEKKMVEDTIVVTPTFYDDVSEERMKNRIESSVVASVYGDEVANYLLPAVVEKYSTYSSDSSIESIKEARHHFAYAGYSQGAICGLNTVMPKCYDLFGSYGLFSGNSGSLDSLVSIINQSKNPVDYFFMGRGDQDTFIGSGAKTNYEMLLEKCDKISSSNSAYIEIYDTGHYYDSFITQLYNFLPRIFK